MPYVLMELAGLYLVPTGIAFCRHHHQRGSITIINVFLGWTLLGWVGALAWSASGDQPTDSSTPSRIVPMRSRWRRLP
jgi:hypothetical protein